MSRERIDHNLLAMVASRVKELRLASKHSQESLSEETKLHIGRIETGRYNITLTSISVLCKFFGITVEEFFKGIK
ncbi:MAG: helix-turn-helix domain-containing protein [Alistipes sp.]|nr:helix-turn-helix domain-containing protein [Alistipes sp.]